MTLSDFTDRVRQAILLSTLVSSSVRLKRRGNSLIGLCPFHKEKTPSFTVNDTKGLYYCFGCQAKGDHFNFLMQTQGITFAQAMEHLSQKTGIPLPASAPHEDNLQHYQWMDMASSWFRAQFLKQDECGRYLASRAFRPEIIEEFKIGYAPSHLDESWQSLWEALRGAKAQTKDLILLGLVGQNDTRERTFHWFRDRIMIPICDHKGRVIGFGGRTRGADTPKYLNSPETPLFHKRSLLFAQHLAMMEAKKMQELFIVEGYFDVMALFQSGIRRAVSSLGTSLTDMQVQLAWKLVNVPTICFDGDLAGQKAAARVLEFIFPLLKPGYSVDFMFLPHGEDPDTYIQHFGKEEFLKRAHEKKPLIDFLWEHEYKQGPLTTPEQKAEFAQRIKSYCGQIMDSSVRSAYEMEIKKRLYSQLYSWNNKKAAAVSPANPSRKRDIPLLQQQLVLWVVINHPFVLQDDLEIFASLPFAHPDFEKLKIKILDFFKQGNLEREALIHYLKSEGFGGALKTLEESKALKMHGRFAEQKALVGVVKEGWRELIFQIIKKTGLDQDIHRIRSLLKQRMSQEEWYQLKALIVESRKAFLQDEAMNYFEREQ